MANEKNYINTIAVRGFKSLRDKQSVQIAPLTILAGANSSGKSSIMQPLLLLKQTLEAAGDPGALLLDGPNARFTSADQLIYKGMGEATNDSFSVEIGKANGLKLELTYHLSPGLGFDVSRMLYTAPGTQMEITPGMSHEAILAMLPKQLVEMMDDLTKKNKTAQQWHAIRDRCFLGFAFSGKGRGESSLPRFWPVSSLSPSIEFVNDIQSVIHLPGLRGNPRRTYPKTAVGTHFPGTFDAYTASVISKWLGDKQRAKISGLGHDLERLGLTWKVHARPVDDTQVELLVGRLPHSKRGGAQDLVSIADVGFGVSQSLPVLVALISARQGQLVYLEQPEIHLHPRAQRILAHMLCQTAKRGVLLVIETHSSLLLREIQTLVATDQMPKDDVRLHWLQRDETGATTITTAVPDETGAYGKWPQDFDDTELEAEQAYLDAVEKKVAAR